MSIDFLKKIAKEFYLLQSFERILDGNVYLIETLSKEYSFEQKIRFGILIKLAYLENYINPLDFSKYVQIFGEEFFAD